MLHVLGLFLPYLIPLVYVTPYDQVSRGCLQHVSLDEGGY